MNTFLRCLRLTQQVMKVQIQRKEAKSLETDKFRVP